jgi:peptide/nickel transport system permease protein
MSGRGGLKQTVREVLGTKSGVFAISIIVVILSLSVAAILYMPFKVVEEWNNPLFWQGLPRLAAPSWVSPISGRRLPQTIVLSERDFLKYNYTVGLVGVKYITLIADFDYTYDGFPSELSTVLRAEYAKNRPLIDLKLRRPDGLEVVLFHGVLSSQINTLYLSVDEDTKARVLDFILSVGSEKPRFVYPEVALFAVTGASMSDPAEARVLKGKYQLRIDVTAGEGDDVDAELRVYGQVYGLAGTDSKRRDLVVGLVWGAPVALAFGLSAAVMTSVCQALVGALSAWYGGIVDELIQRATDVYMIIPFLPILITVSVVYRIDISTLLLIVVLLSLLGGMTKTSRSMTLQVMREQYIEAALSYGASRPRILLLYIMPRLIPYIIANIVLSVPAFVFLEAALSLLGLGDPRLPTWGKIIGEAYEGGAAVHGLWWWILLPSALIVLTAAAFAFLGYALDNVINPRLRER